jgi:hypothetical protein
MNNKKISSKLSNIPFAEIIESTLEKFTAQCWKWDKGPAFGSLVYTENNHSFIIGCISYIQTSSKDPSRYPFPYQKTEEELHKEQPQIFDFLTTVCTIHTLGYISKESNSEKIFYTLPLYPPKIHAFVSECSLEFKKIFFQKTFYLDMLFAHLQQTNSLDELLLVIIQQMFLDNIITKELLNNFCNNFSILTGNDYKRLKLFLSRVEEIIPEHQSKCAN